MVRTITATASMLILLVAAAACGGDDDDSGSTTPDAADTAVATQPAGPTTAASPEEGDDDTPAPPSGDAAGTMSINGDEIDVTEVRRCEPFSDQEGNLDLTAIGEGAMLFVVVNDVGTSLAHELSLQGGAAGGVFSASANESGGSWFDEDGAPIAGPPFTVSGDRISGAMTLADARGGSDTADVTFDIEIPSEIIDCSL